MVLRTPYLWISTEKGVINHQLIWRIYHYLQGFCLGIYEPTTVTKGKFPEFPKKRLPYLFVFIFIPPRWDYNFQPCDISSEVVRVFGIPKGFDLARKRVTQSTTKHFLGGGFNPCEKYARQIGLPSGKQT